MSVDSWSFSIQAYSTGAIKCNHCWSVLRVSLTAVSSACCSPISDSCLGSICTGSMNKEINFLMADDGWECISGGEERLLSLINMAERERKTCKKSRHCKFIFACIWFNREKNIKNICDILQSFSWSANIQSQIISKVSSASKGLVRLESRSKVFGHDFKSTPSLLFAILGESKSKMSCTSMHPD